MSKTLTLSLDNLIKILEKNCLDEDGIMHFDPEHLDMLQEETEYLGERLGLSPLQCVFLAQVIQTQEKSCSIRNIGCALGMRYLQTLSYAKDFYALQEKGYIRITPDKEIKVLSSAIESLMKDNQVTVPQIDGLSSRGIILRIGRILKLVRSGQIDEANALGEIDLYIKANTETGFGSACNNYFSRARLDDNERYLIYILSHLYANQGFTSFDADDVQRYLTDEVTQDIIQERFEDGSLILLKDGILRYANRDGLMSRGCYSFKDSTIKEFFAEIKPTESSLHTVTLSDSNSKPEKQLFYNPKEQEQVERLAGLIGPEHLKDIYEAMSNKGLRTGFTCLFYGAPGTGKTETVYQLARRTGRKILQVDVAELRNCFVGETEKNVRRLFADYRLANMEENLTPILLFNEADAILGTRMEGAARAVDRMENSVQNIILQEMEDFSGILIATTNLSINLDPAFERRFLYKIRFDKPELEPRRLIWKSMFPTLSDDEAQAIASEFTFSGGQIENIVRKYTIDTILSGKEIDFPQLRQYCIEEAIINEKRKTIGFNTNN